MANPLNLRYRRHNLRTGQVYEEAFNPTQIPGIDHMSVREMLQAVARVVERWNKQQPRHWSYEVLFSNTLQLQQETLV
jgi:hypothetical protein